MGSGNSRSFAVPRRSKDSSNLWPGVVCTPLSPPLLLRAGVAQPVRRVTQALVLPPRTVPHPLSPQSHHEEATLREGVAQPVRQAKKALVPPPLTARYHHKAILRRQTPRKSSRNLLDFLFHFDYLDFFRRWQHFSIPERCF